MRGGEGGGDVSSVFHLQVAFRKNDISFSSKIVSYVRIKMHVPLLCYSLWGDTREEIYGSSALRSLLHIERAIFPFTLKICLVQILRMSRDEGKERVFCIPLST